MDIIGIALILVFGSALFVYSKRANGHLKKLLNEGTSGDVNLHLIESIPSTFSSIGVLGTFVGISIGLFFFKTAEIETSIEELLTGLKFAFVTSIAGLILSVVYKDKIQKALKQVEDKEEHSSDELNALNSLVSEIKALRSDISGDAFLLRNGLIGDHENSLLEQMKESWNTSLNYFEASELLIKENGKQLEGINKGLKINQKEIKEEAERVVLEVSSQTKALVEGFDSTNKQMTKSNDLLTKKFDEFSNLLAKNNTEALVAVMKSATQEFNKQMSEIVSRLVQENFSELNKSVQQMNSWQKDNKEMIGTLTNQFNQATKNIETTSLQLKDISEKTQSLVADNGKLSEIIKALREVMVDDKKYQSLVNQLTSVVDKLEKNTEQWDETTNKLNSWIVKQRNFNDSIAILMNKLEHVEKVKDINESFWNNTKAQMNEGVGIIKNANQQLANDLETINGQFVEQLNTTLTSLDTLIQRIIQQYE